jgi:hypothetical protein
MSLRCEREEERPTSRKEVGRWIANWRLGLQRQPHVDAEYAAA